MIERFDEYMERCLYHPTEGFYAAVRGIAGRRGDFITSPEVGPLFGAVLARALDSWWNQLDRPDPFPVIDLGTGPGTLLRSLMLAAPRCASAWELIGVDRANDIALPADLRNSVVIANELLDNVPFRVMKRAGDSWAELYVAEHQEQWQTVAADDSVLASLPGDLAPDQPIPVLTGARSLLDTVLDAGPARVVVFDYGTATTRELAERGGWLRTYRDHRRGSDPLVEPGAWDITTDVAVDQLPQPDAVGTQAEFLLAHGIEELVAEGREYWASHAARPDVEAMRMRSRVREAEALLDPDGLGSWLCLEWVPGTGTSP